MNKFNQGRRRSLMLMAGATAGYLCNINPLLAQTRELTYVGWGGSYQDAQRTAHFEPFEKKTGVKFREVGGGPRLAKLKAQIDSGNVEWDLVDFEWADLLRAGAAGLLEPIDTSIVDAGQVVEEGRHEFGIMSCYYAMVLGRNTDKFPDGKPQPVGWEGFWDVEQFPGMRCIKDTPKGALEGALIADGVPLADLYPLDVDRAFKKLDELKAHIGYLYSGPAQAVQLLTTGEVAMASISHNRLQSAIDDGAPIAIDWNQGRLDADFWCIPKGSKNVDTAMQFIADAIDAQQQAKLAALTGLGPSNGLAMDHLSEEELDTLPSTPERMANEYWTNNQWWMENEEEVLARWELWKLS